MLNRRQFIALGAAMPAFAATLPRPAQPRFAYVGSSSEIVVFSIDAEGVWSPIQRVSSLRPQFLLFNRKQTLLFAANAVDAHEGCPRGTVESYAVDSASGHLTLIARQPLSLSATGARHIEWTPEETHLLVTAFGGGAYNVLPVSKDGVLGAPSHILKEAGCSIHPVLQASSHPHSLASHSSAGFVIASDFGRDCLSVFATDKGQLRRRSHCSVTPGDGPSAIAFAGDGTIVMALNRLSRSISLREFNPSSGVLSREVARKSIGGSTMLVDRDYLYVAGKRQFAVLRLGQPLDVMQHNRANVVANQGLALLPGGDGIVTLEQDGQLRKWSIDQKSGRLSNPVIAASVGKPLSVALRI